MIDNHFNIGTTGQGEISEDCCSNCKFEFNKIDDLNKSNKFKWFDPQIRDEKDIGIVEAAVVVFEGLLNMNGKQISPTESLSMCLTCIFNVSELYRNYREFMERSVTGSYFRELFPLCMLWPSTNTKIDKSVVSANHKSKELDKNRLYSVESFKKTEDDLNSASVKVEIPWDGKIENDEDYCAMALPSDNEDCFEKEPFIITTKRKRTKNKKYISKEVKSVKPPQFLNGEWILPKAVKIVLTKYVPGDPNTLDIGKSTKLVGKTIRVDQDSYLTVKKTCSICNKRFTNMTIYFEHRREHTEKKERRLYPCNYCGKLLKGKYKLFAHEKAVHSTERPFECETCGKTFPLKERLKVHVKHFHENTIEFRRELLKRKIENRKAKGLPPRIKNKYVSSWESSHPNEMDKVFCALCQKTYSTPQAKDIHHRTVHLNEKPLKCKFCGHGFIIESQLRSHEKTHLGIRKQDFICTKCGKKYVRSRDLKEHIASVHVIVNPCVCEECGKTYATRSKLQQHKRWVHSTQDTRHKCEQCGKILKNRQVYLCHLKLHTDERPFLCTVCGALFKTRKPLLKHTVTQHQQNAAATCQQCERGFMKISDYEEHMAKGYHIKPKWLRPTPTRKRNYNAPSYVKARIERKLERQLKRLGKDPNFPIEIQSELKKEAEEKLKLLQVKKREKKSAQKAEENYADEPLININDNNDEYESDEYEEEDQTQQWVEDPLLCKNNSSNQNVIA